MTQILTSPRPRFAARAPSIPGDYFRALAEQLEEAVLLVAPSTGMCLFANLRAAELTGWSREDLSQLSLAELVVAADAPDALDQIHGTLNRPPRTLLNVPLRTRSRRVTHVDLRVATVHEADGASACLLILAQPAARRMTVEAAEAQRARALAALDRMVAALLESNPTDIDRLPADCAELLDADGAALYLVTTATPGLELRSAFGLPSTFPSQLGASEAQACFTPYAWRSGQRPDSLLAQAARAGGWAALLTHPLADGKASSGMIVAGYRAGHTLPGAAPLWLGLAARLVSTLLDQETRRQIQREAEAQAARLLQQSSTIFDSIGDGLMLVGANGEVTQLNASGQLLLGYARGEVIGCAVGDVLISRQPIGEAIRGLLAGQPTDNAMEAVLLKRDGAEFPARLRLAPLCDEAGRTYGAAVLFTDITERKSFETQARHLEQQAFLGEMSAIFAHEVRNPLNGIAMGLEVIAARTPEGDSLHGTIAKIRSETNRIDQLLRDILLVARPAEVRFEPIDVQAFVDRILTRFAPRLARRNVELSRHFIPHTPRAWMDARMIEQAIINLIENAIQAMEDGGTLSITVGPASNNGPPGERGTATGQERFVQIDIGDTGPGIPPEVQKRIFEPFFTTKSDGTGLGLTIAKRFIHVHRGRLNVQSWPNIGTIFTIQIPVAEGEP